MYTAAGIAQLPVIHFEHVSGSSGIQCSNPNSVCGWC